MMPRTARPAPRRALPSRAVAPFPRAPPPSHRSHTTERLTCIEATPNVNGPSAGTLPLATAPPLEWSLVTGDVR